MTMLQWTPYQWRLIYEMLQSNEWKLSRFFDKENNNQIDIWLFVFGPLGIVDEREKAFGGCIMADASLDRKGAPDDGYAWILRGKELDDFLETMWIMISKIDPHFRLTDVRQAQDIRKRVREGNSYAYGQSKSAKGR